METIVAIVVAVATGLCVVAWNAPPLLKNIVRSLYSVLVWISIAVLSWSAGYKSGLQRELGLTPEQADSFVVLTLVGIAAAAIFLMFLEFVIAAWVQDNRDKKD